MDMQNAGPEQPNGTWQTDDGMVGGARQEEGPTADRTMPPVPLPNADTYHQSAAPYAAPETNGAEVAPMFPPEGHAPAQMSEAEEPQGQWRSQDQSQIYMQPSSDDGQNASYGVPQDPYAGNMSTDGFAPQYPMQPYEQQQPYATASSSSPSMSSSFPAYPEQSTFAAPPVDGTGAQTPGQYVPGQPEPSYAAMAQPSVAEGSNMTNSMPQSSAYTAFGQPGMMPGAPQPYGVSAPGMPGAIARPVAKKKSSKKVIIAIAAVILVVVVAAGILFGLYANGIIGGPKLQDYRDAAAQAEKIADDQNSLTLHVVEDIASGLNADDDIDTDKIKTEAKDYQHEVGAFSSLKALKDETVKSAYTTMSGKTGAYGRYLTKLDDSLPDFADVISSCTNKVQGDEPSLSLYQQYDQYFTSCSAKITEVGTFPSDSLDDYAQSIKTYVEQKQGLMKQMEALGDPDAFTEQSQLDQLNGLVDQFNAVKEPSSDGTKLGLDVTTDMSDKEPVKELVALERAVNNGIENKGGHSFKFKRGDDDDHDFDFGGQGDGGNGDDGLGGGGDIFSQV